jgi:methionyl-tRNA formyltransferase
MRLLFLGSGEFAVPTLRWLAESDHEVPLVITQPARPSGRGRKSTPTAVAEFARSSDLEVLETPDVNEASVVARIRSLSVHVGVVIAFGQKLRGELLGTAGACFVNLHASLLPKYRGAAPINWAIIHGEEKTGCTVFRIVERMDAGPILTQRWTFIKPEEQAGELHDRLARVGVDAMQATLREFDGGAVPNGASQDEGAVTLAPKLKKQDGLIRFGRTAREVVNHVHGVTPWPGATAVYRSREGRDEPVQLIRARPSEAPSGPLLPPGTLDSRLEIAVADGFVEVLEIKPSAGRTMTWPEFVNGRRVRAGDIILTPELG